MITALTLACNNVTNDVTSVDTALGKQVIATGNVEGYRDTFSATMKQEAPFIARALGGEESDGYKQFLPHGEPEYTTINIIDMETLTGRVFTAADDNHVALGGTLTALLQAFKEGWNTIRGIQEGKKGIVSADRGGRDVNRDILNQLAWNDWHIVASNNNSDFTIMNSYFKFSLCYSHAHHKHVKKSGTILAGKTVNIFNLLFTDLQFIDTSNTTDNANIQAYKSDSSSGEPVGDEGIMVNHNISEHKKAPEYGSIDKPFFNLKNLSDVNDATYVVSIVE
jgi:hypothetical protein